jgi:hypothetical protein
MNLGSVAKAGNSPIKQSKISEVACETMHTLLLQVNVMLFAMFRQTALGLQGCAHHTESACCRTTVSATLKEALATRLKPSIHAIRLLNIWLVSKQI